MWNGKMKALTFSYDDGVWQDVRLSEIFRRYNLKCTFNLNSGLIGDDGTWEYRQAKVGRLGLDDLLKVCEGHEVAAHGRTHPFLDKLTYDEAYDELKKDCEALEKMFGKAIRGMAYPYGTYNGDVIKAVKNCGLEYGRTVEVSRSFALPENPLLLKATCHQDDEMLFSLADEFINGEAQEPMLFYVWGHSYEFDGNQNWDNFERFCEKIAGKDDIYYCTNLEALPDN